MGRGSKVGGKTPKSESTLGDFGRGVLDAVAAASKAQYEKNPSTNHFSAEASTYHKPDQNSYGHGVPQHQYSNPPSSNAYHAQNSASNQQQYNTSSHSAMDYNQYAQQQQQQQQHQQQAYAGQYGNPQYAYPPAAYGAQFAQQPQQQQQQQQFPTPPQIRNPFAPPVPAASSFAAQNAGFDPDLEQQIAQWQSAYVPADQQMGRKGGKPPDPANAAIPGPRGTPQASADAGDAKAKKDDGKLTVIRKGGGEVWEDKSLLEWDPTKFRIMVGNLAGEVTDDSLAKAFAAYGVTKARVIRDKRTTKSKGFGFVEFEEGEQGFKAARDMVGKYIGSHPVTIQRAKTDVRPAVKKDKDRHRGKNNHGKSKDSKSEKGPLKAHTGAGVEKKTAKGPAPGLKLLG
jgi:hypothetical protein